MNNVVDPNEARWQREDDARTLARAEEIKADKERYANAKKGAKELLEQRAKELYGLEKVANKKINKAKVNNSDNVFPDIFRR